MTSEDQFDLSLFVSPAQCQPSMVRVGVVGYGNLGQYLVENIERLPGLELAWVWNRNKSSLRGRVAEDLILSSLSDCGEKSPDVIVEVAHPDITRSQLDISHLTRPQCWYFREFGAKFLSVADFMMGSPTALADPEVETMLKVAAVSHGVYIPSGALWGGEDIRKMAERGTLTGLTVTMRKHPASFKLEGELRQRNDAVLSSAEVLYHGPVRQLCPLAPNNVNTVSPTVTSCSRSWTFIQMAAAAVAATNLGFDKTVGRLVSDPSIPNWHVVEVMTHNSHHLRVESDISCAGGGGGPGGTRGREVPSEDISQ